MGGAMDLTLDAWDYVNNNNGSFDRIGVTLISGPSAPPGCTAGGLVFSSYWSNGATQHQLITAGNINVRAGGSNGNGSPAVKVDLVKTENPVQQISNPFEAKAFPNPSERHFTIVIESNSKEPVQVNVFDIAGRQVTTIRKNFGEAISFGDNLKIGTYVAEIIQGDKRKAIKLVKQ